MRELTRAATQLACEATIYTCRRILEHLASTRPNIDDPLPEPGPNFWPDELEPIVFPAKDWTPNPFLTLDVHEPGREPRR